MERGRGRGRGKDNEQEEHRRPLSLSSSTDLKSGILRRSVTCLLKSSIHQLVSSRRLTTLGKQSHDDHVTHTWSPVVEPLVSR